MKKLLFILSGSYLGLVGCAKEETCVAKSSDGTALYEVVGEETCSNQIKEEEGEICVCER